jgi:hypothetical protein
VYPILDYRQTKDDARHPLRAFGVAAAFGVGWGALPLGIFLIGGGQLISLLSLVLYGWSAIAGVSAGAITIWTRRRSNGAETPFGLVGTYYAAIVCFWFGCCVLGGWINGGHPHSIIACLSEAALDGFGILIYLTRYATIFGIITVPICYICRQQVWELYLGRRD